MNILEHRIASFHNSITKWPYTNKKYHKTETFAKAGFYFLTRPKLPDTTRCFLCDIELSHWKQGQSPYIRHATESPSCPWVILNFPDDPTKRSTIKLQPQHPKMRAARLATFNSHNFWPPVKRDVAGRRKFLASTKLADAGFILSPTSDNKSRVKCPYCQCCINTPINDIDALKSHSQFNSACIFFDQSNNVGSKVRRNTGISISSTDTYKTANSDISDVDDNDDNDSTKKCKSPDSNGDNNSTKKRKSPDSNDDSFWDIGNVLSLESALPKKIRRPTFTFGTNRTSHTTKRHMGQVDIFSNAAVFNKKQQTSSIEGEPIVDEPVVAIRSKSPIRKRKRTISKNKEEENKPIVIETNVPEEKETTNDQKGKQPITEEDLTVVQTLKKDKGKGRAIEPPPPTTSISLSKSKPKPAPNLPSQSAFTLQSNPIPTPSRHNQFFLQSTPVRSTTSNRVHASDIFGDIFPYSPIVSSDDDQHQPFVTPMQGRTRQLINEQGKLNMESTETPPIMTLDDDMDKVFDLQEKDMTVEDYLQHVIDTNIYKIREEGNRLVNLIQEKSNTIKQQLLSQKVNL